MNQKVLFVDDDSNVLVALKRHLRKQFHAETAVGPEDGLSAVLNQGPYAVVVSDLRMPKMDGIQFLSRVKEMAPDTVRMMLTGHADVQTAIEAVNEGNIFRLLTKPCNRDDLAKSIKAGLEQYRLATAEKELLAKTLRGSIKVLTELLAMINPEAFGRCSRIKRTVVNLADHMGIKDLWQLETAAMLSQIGFVTMPEEILRKRYRGTALTEEEQQLFDMHPSIASDLLSKIPRLEEVAEIITYQEKHFDGSGIPSGSRQGKDIPPGARILKAVLDLDALENSGVPKMEAIAQMENRSGWYDPSVLNAMRKVIGIQIQYAVRALSIKELKSHMILAEDVRSDNGQLLISKGQEVTWPLIERLKNYTQVSQVKEPIRVAIPLHEKETSPQAPV